MRNSLPSADRKMMPAFGHNHLIVGQLLRKHCFSGQRIFGVDPLGNVFLAGFPDSVGGFIEMAHEGSTVGNRDNIQIQNAGAAEYLGTTIEGGSCRENVVDQNIMLFEM